MSEYNKMQIKLEQYERTSVDNYGGKYVVKPYTMPKGSLIIDLKFAIAKDEGQDPLEYEVTTSQQSGSYRGFTDDMTKLEEGKIYNCHCQNTSTNRLSYQISHPSQHPELWDPCILRTPVMEYLVNKYNYVREPIIVTLKLKICGKYSFSYQSDEFTFDNFVIDPFMTFGKFKERIMGVVSDKNIVPFDITDISLYRDSKYEILKGDNKSHIPDTFKGRNADNFVMLNRLANGYIFEVYVHTNRESASKDSKIDKQRLENNIRDLSITKPYYVVIKFIKNMVYKTGHGTKPNKEVTDIFYVNKNYKLDWIRHQLNSTEKRKVKMTIIDKHEQEVELEYDKPIRSYLKYKDGIMYEILEKVPMKDRPNDEVEKMAFMQFNDNLIKVKKLLPTYKPQELVRRKNMLEKRVPVDLTVTLTDGKEELFSTSVSSGIIMLHAGPFVEDVPVEKPRNNYDYYYEDSYNTYKPKPEKKQKNQEDKFAVNKLELFLTGGSKFADGQAGIMTIDITNDFLFSHYSLEQHKACIKAIINYCYLGTIDGIDFKFILAHYNCLQEWAVQFHLGEFYHFMEMLVKGEFIRKYIDNNLEK
jgi:hypothetical protein